MLDAEGKAAVTVQERADRVMAARGDAGPGRPPAAVVETDPLEHGDVSLTRRVVIEAGFHGAEADEMTRRVSDRVTDMIRAAGPGGSPGAGA